ncbi:hypothetical protein MK489_13815 [Myxococcota bacterium]|nr:hypothetical protein [Myxococcota bacterium]
MLKRAVATLIVGVLLAKQAGAGLSLAAWGVILAVVGLIAAIGIVLSTSDNNPEIGAIQIQVLEGGPSDWYVGQLRAVSVETDVSFGHIRGDDVGVITLEIDFNGDVAHRETRRYTEKNDGDPDTVTLGRWEGTITFAVEVEALDHGVGTIGAKITVDGESNGLFTDPAVSVSDNATLPVEALYPLERQSGSSAIGWLDPANDAIFHHECFDQTLQVRNRATVPGQIESARISHTTAENVSFNAASNDSTAAVTEIVTGSVGHENTLGHVNSTDFSTDWSLQGSSNVRLFLRKDSQWSHDGGTGPSSQNNTCQGGTLNCALTDVNLPPSAHNVNTSYALEILSRSEPSRPGAFRDIAISDNSGFSQTRTTDSAGDFTLTAPALGPLVTVNLVNGTDAALFEPKTLAAVNASLFDPSVAPSFQTFHIMEREAPPILGQVVDDDGNPMTVDLYSVGVGDEEHDLGRFTGAIDIPGGLDLSQIGYPDALFLVRILPTFNRSYLKTELEVSLPSGDSPLNLGTLVFDETPAVVDPVTFRGHFEVRDPEGLGTEALAGLLLEVEGIGTAMTNAQGDFEIVVPASVTPRIVRLANPENLTTSLGKPLLIEGTPEVSIEFGRSGPTLDLGAVTLHSMEPPPTPVPVLPPAMLALLIALLGILGLHHLRTTTVRAPGEPRDVIPG